MGFFLADFSRDSNPAVEAEIGRNRYVLIGDLVPLISLARQRVLVEWEGHSVEKPEVKGVSFEPSFFSGVFSCPPPAGKAGCTCCSPIRGVSLHGAEAAGAGRPAISHTLSINGIPREFSMFKGSCPLFNGSCSLGGSAETFYSSVPLPCAISPGWNVRVSGGSALVGRKACRHGLKASYPESRLREDQIILGRISAFLLSLSLEPAFSPVDLGRCLKSQLL